MALTSSFKVLNTVTALGVDIYVDSNGIVQGLQNPVNANQTTKVIVTPKVTQVLQVATFLVATGTANANYTVTIHTFNAVSGVPMTIPVTYANGVSTNTTTIATALAAAINAACVGTSFVATTSTATIILTAVSPLTTPADDFAIFPIPTSTDAKLTIYACDGSNGSTIGVQGVGYGTQLAAKYLATTAMPPYAGGWGDASLITTTNNYTQVSITDSVNGQSVLIVNEAATNFNDLLGVYGTITGLAAGYRVTGSLMTTATAGAITAAVQILTNGTLGSTVGAQSGDYIVSISTPVIQKISGVLTETTYLASTTTALTSGSSVNIFKWRNIPK